ncbi:hypothetical protein [Mangrovimonas sp. YM274]|uniref:hypothetical protein n=1 Tax=Mangrovimonas sp. YM274 TaxID=3070660 RepID=UPI0027DB2EE3|nr:hypothetical protein [Mangrovimonas sp. YM274]WMI70213.1 hypothetical protein RBH95_07640 [Mangrovimonas sp. YM274]
MNSNNERIDSTVFLTVDTANINPGNVKLTAILSDNRNDSPEQPGDPTNFTTAVDRDKSVTWQGIVKEPTTNPNDSVQIILIARKPGDNGGAKFLKHGILETEDMSTVSGKIRDKKKEKDEENENYYIVFTVNYDFTNPYILDPKLKMTDKI